MTNRRAINSARTKLATDTARQIVDLRAQGEFQKAEALLELPQTYLSQLTARKSNQKNTIPAAAYTS